MHRRDRGWIENIGGGTTRGMQLFSASPEGPLSTESAAVESLWLLKQHGTRQRCRRWERQGNFANKPLGGLHRLSLSLVNLAIDMAGLSKPDYSHIIYLGDQKYVPCNTAGIGPELWNIFFLLSVEMILLVSRIGSSRVGFPHSSVMVSRRTGLLPMLWNTCLAQKSSLISHVKRAPVSFPVSHITCKAVEVTANSLVVMSWPDIAHFSIQLPVCTFISQVFP